MGRLLLAFTLLAVIDHAVAQFPLDIIREVMEDDDDLPKSVRRVFHSASRSAEEQDSPKIVETHVVHRGPESDSSLDEAEHVIDTTSNLFGSLLGILSGRVMKEVMGDDPPPRNGRVRMNTSSRHSESEESMSPIASFVDIFDTVSNIPFQNQRIHGEHICVREITSTLTASSKTYSVNKGCQTFNTAHRCIDRKETPKGGRQTIRVQECCDGFTTSDIVRKGCPNEIESKTAETALRDLNSSVVEMFEREGMSQLTDKGPLTFIIPNNVALDGVEGDAKATLLSHVLAEKIKDYDMMDGDELKTLGGGVLHVKQEEGRGEKQSTLLNCVPLSMTNIPVSNGVVHIAKGVIQPASGSVMEYLQKDGRFGRFIELMDDGLKEKLSSSERHTVFAFSDTVFERLSKNIQEELTKKMGCVKDVAKNHVVRSALCEQSIGDQPMVSLAGNVLRSQQMFDKSDKVVRVGNARIVSPNHYAANGIVHEIDDVILKEELLTWKDHLPQYNDVLMEGLKDVAIEAEPLTIFVPPADQSKNVSDMVAFALNHIVKNRTVRGLREATNLTTGANSTIFAGTFIHRSPFSLRIGMRGAGGDKARIGCSIISEDAVPMCNAIIHFIDKPLPLVSHSIRSLLESREELSRFRELWLASSVAKHMDSERPITVFAPSNDAMSNNVFRRLQRNATRLDAFVKRYIVDEPLCNFDLARRRDEIKYETYPNLAGESLRASGDGEGGIYLDGARLEETELVTSNGVVHILETTIEKQLPGRHFRLFE